jgi:DNA-binding CsgD family transcriptional regulator
MYTHEDITSELIIKPYHSGIQLVKPEQGGGGRLREIYDSSITTYFQSTECRIIGANEATAEFNGANSIRDLIGLDAHDIWNNEAACKMQSSGQHVMCNETLQISDFSALRSADESYLHMISFKLPWYEQEKVIGVFGMTLELNTRSPGEFAMNLTRIIATGLINSSQLSTLQALPQATNDQVYLSKREMDILKLLVKNLTAKQIAERLFISKRTVENYLANIKLKFNCDSKFELIEKFYWKLSRIN